MTALWVSVILGILIVALAVGLPFWLTHRRMRPHYGTSEGQAYLGVTGKTGGDAAQGRPGRPPGPPQAGSPA